MSSEYSKHSDFKSRASRAKLKQLLIVVALAAAIIGIDQLSKILVEMRLNLGEVGLDWGIIAIRRSFNTGLAWGFFDNFGTLFSWLIPIVVVLLALYYLYFLKNSSASFIFSIAFGLIIGGAIGNAVDRLRQGGVTDFIDPSFWATFNIADASISVGFVMLILALFFMSRRTRSAPNSPNQSNDTKA